MIERFNVEVNIEPEKYSHVGVVTTGLVVCDIFSEQGNGMEEWLTQLFEVQTMSEQDVFTFKFQAGRQIDTTDFPRTEIVLANKEQASINFDPSQGFLLEGPLNDINFRQRIPYLIYTLTERIRQQKLGVVTIHGAAVAKERRGILILGDKGVGKTSTLLWLTLENGYKMIGNDLVLLRNEEPLTLIAGSHTIDIRDCVRSKFDKLSHIKGTENQVAGSYERKTRVFPKDIGISTELNPVPLSMIIRINLHNDNTQLVCLREKLPILAELLRLNENLSRYIRGVTTPLQIKNGNITGYYPSLDTKELCEMRNIMINRLINETPFYYIFAGNFGEIARCIESLLI